MEFVMFAENLPLKTRKEFNVWSGLVEITLNGLKIINITKLKGTFSDNFERVIKEEGFINIKIL